MPTRPRKPCHGIGMSRGVCPALALPGGRYCLACQPLADQQSRGRDGMRRQRGDYKFLNTTQWRKIRNIQLHKFPFCECGSIAILVHHIDEDQTNNDPANLASKCNPCHELIHGPDRFRRK